MSEESKPPNDGGFIYYQNSLPYSFFNVSDIMLDARQYKHPASLVTATSTKFGIEYLKVLCAAFHEPVVKDQSLAFFLYCELSCPEKIYIPSR